MRSRHQRTAEITEVVLSYEQAQLDAWKAGDRSVMPPFAEVTPNLANQPDYHFGKMFVLRHHYESGDWKGFAGYALAHQYPNSKRRLAGRLKAAEIIPATKLRRFRALRPGASALRGEPDLFLYDNDGRFKFVEVKKEGDRLRGTQFRCIAQILATLGCEVEIAYLKEESRRSYESKTYVFDLNCCPTADRSNRRGPDLRRTSLCRD